VLIELKLLLRLVPTPCTAVMNGNGDTDGNQTVFDRGGTGFIL